MKNVLITGGAGFIGTALTGILLNRECHVRVFDNLRRDLLGKKGIVHPNLEVIRGDVLDLPSLFEAMEDIDTVVHCAAIAGIDTVIKSPTATMRINLVGTANALQAAVAAGKGIHRFVNFSTSEVFGRTAFGAEETTNAVTGSVGEARWTYAVSKLAGEHLAHAYWTEHRLPVVTVRPFNIYGPGQVGEGAIHHFVKRALQGEDLVIYGDGSQIRAWCYIDDFIRGLELTLENPDAVGESFNIGNARAVVTIYGLAEAIIRVLGSSSKIRYEPARSVDVELRVPRVEKARRILGFEAQVDLETGILRTAEYYRALLESRDTAPEGNPRASREPA